MVTLSLVSCGSFIRYSPPALTDAFPSSILHLRSSIFGPPSSTLHPPSLRIPHLPFSRAIRDSDNCQSRNPNGILKILSRFCNFFQILCAVHRRQSKGGPAGLALPGSNAFPMRPAPYWATVDPPSSI